MPIVKFVVIIFLALLLDIILAFSIAITWPWFITPLFGISEPHVGYIIGLLLMGTTVYAVNSTPQSFYVDYDILEHAMFMIYRVLVIVIFTALAGGLHLYLSYAEFVY